MKKIISVVLTLIMAVSVFPVYAERAEEAERVLLAVKERIPDTQAFEKFQSSVSESEGYSVYSFEWYSDENDKSMNVTAYDNGIIISYRYYDGKVADSDKKPSINKMLSDEAMKKAQRLANELNPSLEGKIKVEKISDREELYSDTYGFRLQRYENDIPVYNNIGYISVNSDATQILRYSISYTYGMTFDNPDGIIGEENIWNYYYENAGVEPEYRVDLKNDEKKAYIVYTSNLSDSEFINALSGDIMPIWNDNYYKSYNTNAKEEFAADSAESGSGGCGGVWLYDSERVGIDEIAGLKTSDEAKKVVESNEILDFDKDLKLTSVRLYKTSDDEYYYYVAYESNNDNIYKYANATLNAKTLDIVNWRTHSEDYIAYRDENEEITDNERMKNLAENALTTLAPKYFSVNTEYQLDENEKTNSFRYMRYINGIKFKADNAAIEINPKNGKAWSFSINHTDIDFPLPDGIISEREAVRCLSEKSDMKLYYFTTAGEEGNKSAFIGYKHENGGAVDAISGEVEAITDNEELNYNDIAEHYAKKEIETLASFGIGFEGGEYKPDELITVNEYASLLISALVYYSPITVRRNSEPTAEYRSACERGIISGNESSDEPLSREAAAVYMIRAVGLEEAAELQSIYKPYFEDITDNIGYISILGAMGVFNGDENGRFNPDKKLTRADAAIIIYNYLAR